MKPTKVFVFLCVCVALPLALTITFGILYKILNIPAFLTLFITFLTIFYHFAMRFSVGEAITFIYRKKEFKYDSFHCKQHSFEPKLYRFLKVSKWKKHVITAKPEQFDITKRTYSELLHNITQAEFVHEWIMLFSFLPLLFIIPFGQPIVFIVTSIISAAIDGIFVIVQRYNRPMLIKIRKRYEKYHG